MTLSKAISKKILLFCETRNLSINKLALTCYLTQSTVQNLVSEYSKNPKLLTIIKICDGLGISLYEFFEDDLFCDIEYDI